MTREFKPGDVAMVSYGKAGREKVMLRGTNGRWWEPTGSFSDQHARTVRPLVVIDPEDPESFIQSALTEIERVLSLDSDDRHYVREGIAAALREFADPTPSKPEEPTGLGAVVEDRKGGEWVRMARKSGNSWQQPIGKFARYDEIDVLRVLSEGVTS